MVVALIPQTVPVASAADAYTGGGYTYTVEGGEATITDCDRSVVWDIIIPDTLGGYPVTAIGGGVFYYRGDIFSVKIPESVTSIADGAFYHCTNLESIEIPDSVKSIGHRVFFECWSLESVKIPEGVEFIGDEAFFLCMSLESVTIPDSVTSIGKDAFYYCESLKSVTIPESVTSIADSAFDDCYNLTIMGYAGSYAETYAKNEGIPFEVIAAYDTGDINGDGKLNTRDVTALRRYLAGGYEDTITVIEALLDTNGDGKINVRDVVALRKIIAGGY